MLKFFLILFLSADFSFRTHLECQTGWIPIRDQHSVGPDLLIEIINLILAFIINMISQPIEHLNISSALIVYTSTGMTMVLNNTIDVYTAVMINWGLVA